MIANFRGDIEKVKPIIESLMIHSCVISRRPAQTGTVRTNAQPEPISGTLACWYDERATRANSDDNKTVLETRIFLPYGTDVTINDVIEVTTERGAIRHTLTSKPATYPTHTEVLIRGVERG